MKDRETLEMIVEQGHCVGVHCCDCPLNKVEGTCKGWGHSVERATKMLAEMYAVVPELKGVRMLVTNHAHHGWVEATVFVYDPVSKKYIGLAGNYTAVKPLPSKPAPKTLTMAQAMKILEEHEGTDVVIEK